MSLLLHVENLRREYRRGDRFFAAVDGANMDVSPGEFACIIGRSGSGKTTLAGMVAGLITPTSGSILFEGTDVPGLSDDERTVLRNNKIGYVPQGGSLLPYLTVLDNVRLPYFLQSRSGPDVSVEKAMALLEKIGVAHLAGAYPNTLSGGEGKRVAIARALINDPLLLIADEPTSDLDLDMTHETVELMQSLNRAGTTLLVVTHDSEVSGASTTLFAMEAGRLMAR